MVVRLLFLASFALLLGCRSPYAADRGALVGGVGGAALGAAVGEALDNPLAGALVGGVAGTMAGATIGNSIDEAEARNRALIEQQLNRKVRSGAVTVDQVIELSIAGVDDQLIVNHIQANGVAAPPGAAELIRLQQNGVSSRVVSAMQHPPEPQTQQVIVEKERPVYIREHAPVVVEHRYVVPRRRYCPPRRSGVHFSFH